MLRIAVAAATIAAVLVVFLTATYLRFSADDNGAGRGIPVVVAARDIPAGTTISEDMLEVGAFKSRHYPSAGLCRRRS
jgi:Flp pilus assembly protein CpaB